MAMPSAGSQPGIWGHIIITITIIIIVIIIIIIITSVTVKIGASLFTGDINGATSY